MLSLSDELNNKIKDDDSNDEENSASREGKSLFEKTRSKKDQERSGKRGIIALCVIVALMFIGIIIRVVFPPCVNCDEVEPKETVEEYSWKDLSHLSKLISSAPDDTYRSNIYQEFNLVNSEGILDGTQVKSVELADGSIAQVQIAGFNHDDKSDGSGKAGITFIFKDAIAEHAMNSTDTNSGGWENSEMRSWLQSGGMSMLPEDLNSSIIEVEKPTNNTGKTTSTSSITKTSDKLWLLSATELFGCINQFDNYSYNKVLNAEGIEYELSNEKDAAANSDCEFLVRSFDNKPFAWWIRSANPSDNSQFLCIDLDGDLSGGQEATKNNAVVLGFCV